MHMDKDSVFQSVSSKQQLIALVGVVKRPDVGRKEKAVQKVVSFSAVFRKGIQGSSLSAFFLLSSSRKLLLCKLGQNSD